MTKERITSSWLKFLAGAILGAMSAGAGVVSYAYTTFETKSAAIEKKADITQRLDRIETKLDRVLERH